MSCGPSGQPQYLHPRQQVFSTRVFPPESVVFLIPNLMPRVVLQGACNKSLPGVQCNFARAHCTSSRCPVHMGRSPSRSRQCRRNGCTTVVPQVLHQWVLRSSLHEPALQIASRPCLFLPSGCGEVPSPGCVVGMCETHCNHPPMQPSCPPTPTCLHFQTSSEPQSRDLPSSFLH